MRLLLLLTTALLAFSCSKKEKSTISNTSIPKNLTVEQEKKTNPLNENIHYLGFVNDFYFSNENEVYIDLYFTKDDISTKEYTKLEKLADSLIYSDDENSRNRFPADLAAKHFDLRGLQKLAIYDDSNKFVCNADFVRVEYLNQNITPGFIAVYKTDKKIKSDKYYAVSNFEKDLENPNYTILKDSVLTQKLLTELDLPKSYYGLEKSGIHLQSTKSDTIISIINSENSASIVLHHNNTFKVLYKSTEPENINDLRIVSTSKSKLPYLLTRNSKPDTDMVWDQVWHYDGKKYSPANRQRIK
ncbi:hypothetical protein ACFFLS_20000 [Flavobacterium procerum]|uniref:Lipoprotein n=1 Tax=Flavobacterium procerum TaxID=1455569 RepID=A0ABV6BV73_9FLAO